MSEYKINIPRLKLPKKFAKSPAKYLRKMVIDNAEERGLLTPENRDEYLQRIDHEIAVFERCGYVEYLLGVVEIKGTTKVVPFFWCIFAMKKLHRYGSDSIMRVN